MYIIRLTVYDGEKMEKEQYETLTMHRALKIIDEGNTPHRVVVEAHIKAVLDKKELEELANGKKR